MGRVARSYATWAPVEVVPRLVATGGGPNVRLFNAASAQLVFEFFPTTWRPGAASGSHSAPSTATASRTWSPRRGRAAAPHVRVFHGAALLRHRVAEIVGLFAYDPGFSGGVFVAAGDVDGDGRADVITGTGTGGVAHIRAFNGRTGAALGIAGASLFASDPGFDGGGFVAGTP